MLALPPNTLTSMQTALVLLLAVVVPLAMYVLSYILTFLCKR